MVWILSAQTVDTPELDAFFDEADVMPSSVFRFVSGKYIALTCEEDTWMSGHVS